MIVRHEINILDRLVAGISGNIPELINIGNFNSDTTEFYLEVIAKITAGSALVSLYDISNTSMGSITVDSVAYKRYRSVSIDFLSGWHHINIADTNISIQSARVIVIQNTSINDLNISESQFEIGGYGLLLWNSQATDPLTDPKYWYYDSSKWEGGTIAKFYTSVCWSVENNKYWLTVYLQEDDGSFGNWTNKATIVNQGESEDIIISEVEFTPTSGRNYRLAWSTEGTKAAYGANLFNAKVITKVIRDYPDEKLTNPITLPTEQGNRCAFSQDGTYLAVAHHDSPYITIYKRSGDTFTKLTDPSTLPIGTGYGCSFSQDGTYLAVAHFTSPYITIYKRSGDTFTKLTDPSTLPTGTGYGCSFSQDGTYLAVAHFDSPYITIYKRSGDTFTKLTNPSTLPANTGYGCSFSQDGLYLVVAHATSPNITIYKRSGDTFTKMTDPSTLPAGVGYGCCFSQDGTYLAVVHATTPFITIYKRSGDIFTKMTDPSTLPASVGYGCCFSQDGTYLAVAHFTSPFITIYKDNTTLLKITKFEEQYLFINVGQTDTDLQDFDQLYDANEWDDVVIDMYPEHDASSSSSNTKFQTDPNGTPSDVANSSITGVNRVRGGTALSIADDETIDSNIVTA